MHSIHWLATLAALGLHSTLSPAPALAMGWNGEQRPSIKNPSVQATGDLGHRRRKLSTRYI